ncbi:MAG: ATP-binding cassette domain-containing protein [Candidatus Micrarchaeia archaeon]
MTDKTEYAIECSGLVKKFGSFTAVNSLDLRVKKGELFGFLGPNGAGKTTTIKMLTTLLTPTAGCAKVAGYDLAEESAFVRAKIGVVPQEFALFEELSPAENLWYIGELFGMKKDYLKKRTEELLRTVNLYEKKDVRSEGFSGGMKQRLSVAAGLMHTPDILFMDEPTTGLDPQSRIALRELTQRLNASGMTVIYTTHDMEEADKLCERIAVMDKGRVIALGTGQELKRTHGGYQRMTLSLSRHDESLARELSKLVGAKEHLYRDGRIDLFLSGDPSEAVRAVIPFLSKKKIDIHDMNVREPTLEEVFINLTKKDVRD